tara:strand:- start:2488 stop:3354 length:867 start_codon:yes stop_codon:yes gene_type:complete
MKIYVIIPVYNEDSFLEKSINSFINQTFIPKKIIYVDDNSTDSSKSIVSKYSQKFDWIELIQIESTSQHIPGSKIIDAFNKGLKSLDDDYDIVCKFDGDIILPTNYFEKLKKIFINNKSVGIAGGNMYILKRNRWIYENISSKNHVRGPIKAYRKECFSDIGGLKAHIGWDTLDVLLAKKNGWEVYTDKNLQVKHLKKTGSNYTFKSKFLQGTALYCMRFGIILSLLTLIKSSFNTVDITKLFFGVTGYIYSFITRKDPIVSISEGKFIRNYRWGSLKKNTFQNTRID